MVTRNNQKGILALKWEVIKEIERTSKISKESNDKSEKEFYRGLSLAYKMALAQAEVFVN